MIVVHAIVTLLYLSDLCFSWAQMFSYRVKIVNPIRKRDSIVRDIRKFHGKFTSVVDLKVKLMEEFEEQVPPTTRFSVGYFAGRQSTKKVVSDPGGPHCHVLRIETRW